jgi:hypothetical protein
MSTIIGINDLEKIKQSDQVEFNSSYEHKGEIKSSNHKGTFAGYFKLNKQTYFVTSTVKDTESRGIPCNFVSSGLYHFKDGRIVSDYHAITGFSMKSELEKTLNRHLETLKLRTEKE